jgi:hypothetical protein
VSELLPVIIGSSGISALLATIATAFINRRKIKAEATSILTEAAGGIVQILQADNARLRADATRNDILRIRKDRAERERDDQFRLLLSRHHEYDVMLVQKLREAGIQVEDPPRLDFPPYAYTDEDVTGLLDLDS